MLYSLGFSLLNFPCFIILFFFIHSAYRFQLLFRRKGFRNLKAINPQYLIITD
nr:MAG TPA: conotoxin [Caudoviricetes sp.]